MQLRPRQRPTAQDRPSPPRPHNSSGHRVTVGGSVTIGIRRCLTLAQLRYACPRCHRIAQRLVEIEILDVAAYREALACERCAHELEADNDPLSVAHRTGLVLR